MPGASNGMLAAKATALFSERNWPPPLLQAPPALLALDRCPNLEIRITPWTKDLPEVVGDDPMSDALDRKGLTALHDKYAKTGAERLRS